MNASTYRSIREEAQTLLSGSLRNRACQQSTRQQQIGASYEPGVNNSVNKILSRLRDGILWLTKQHKAWLDGDPDAVSHEAFSKALAGWDTMERELRELGYRDCLFFDSGERCPEDGPVLCEACVKPVQGIRQISFQLQQG